MRIDVVTIFPEYLTPLRESLLGRAISAELLSVGVHDLRDHATDRHRTVDDTPYGGGPGMVMKPDVWGRALDAICTADSVLIVPTPAGTPFTQEVAAELATAEHLVFACGRYEGIDQRVPDEAADRMTVRELSIGDYVLAGGEVAVLVIVEAIARLIPGVLGNPASAVQDSFGSGWPGLLEPPAYTRPETYRGLAVPLFCSPVITPQSIGGAGSSRWRAREPDDQTCCRPVSCRRVLKFPLDRCIWQTRRVAFQPVRNP